MSQLKRYMQIMRISKGTLPHFYGHLGALSVFNVCTKPRGILTCEVNSVPICLPHIYQDSTILRLAWPFLKNVKQFIPPANFSC